MHNNAPAGPLPPPSKHQMAMMIWLAVFPTLLLVTHRRHHRGTDRHLWSDAAAAPSSGATRSGTDLSLAREGCLRFRRALLITRRDICGPCGGVNRGFPVVGLA